MWPNQIEALTCIDRYLRARPQSGALVQMPTGTGKTAIIAITARMRAAGGKAVAVLSPSAAIADQLRDDIRAVTWRRLNLAKPWSELTVTTLLRSNAGALRAALGRAADAPQIIVGTLQALTDIRTNAADLYAALKASMSLVLVDEGHKEPSPEWSAAVEHLNVPMILFTATPYRNDFRTFNVDRGHIAYYPFDDALSDGLIRDVAFETLAAGKDARSFALASAERFARMITDGTVDHNAKAILRFADVDSIDSALSALSRSSVAKSLGFVGVHERFTGRDPHRQQTLGDIRSISQRLLLHQFKLTEGVDDPYCSALFIHDDFGNERMVVQQIGRCIRRLRPRARTKEPPAVVVSRASSKVQQSWDMYRAFDRECAKIGHPTILDEAEYGKKLRELSVAAEYRDGKYRLVPPPGLDDDDPTKEAELALTRDVVIPRRCLIYRAGNDFDDELEIVREELIQQDRQILASARPFPDKYPELHVMIAHVIRSSDLFDRFTFLENEYTATVLYKRGDRFFLFDSARVNMAIDKFGPVEFAKLLPQHQSTRITSIASRNTDLSRTAIRGRTTEAASLADTAPALTDFQSVVTRAQGRIAAEGRFVRRYVGLFTGRVSDGRSSHIPLDEFAAWCATLERDLVSQQDAADVFRRFAPVVAAPTIVEPGNILLDLSGLKTDFEDPTTHETLELDDYCADLRPNTTPIRPDHRWLFDVGVASANTANATALCYLKFERDPRPRFRIQSDDLNRFVESGEDKPRSVTQVIDREQSFRLLLRDSAHAYAFGEFFDIGPSRHAMKQVVDDVLIALPALGGLTSEKGRTDTAGRRWDRNSIFGFVDAQRGQLPMRQFFGTWDALICDDTAGEIADFIAYRAGRDPAIALIHIKRPTTTSRLSAASLHEVLSQAVKNLGAATIGADSLMQSPASRWNGDWTVDKRRVKRIRFGPGTGREHFTRFKALLRSANTQRHVCVILGGAIERSELTRQLELRRPSMRAMQAFLQLAAFYNQVASVGAIPTVICN